MPKVWNKKDPNCPKDAIYIGRPGSWGNPYKIGPDGTRAEVVAKYSRYATKRYIDHHDTFADDLRELTGRDLVCWCAPEACHGDVLLRLAND